MLKYIKKCHLHSLDLSLKWHFFNIADSEELILLPVLSNCLFEIVKAIKFTQLEYSRCLFDIINALSLLFKAAVY